MGRQKPPTAKPFLNLVPGGTTVPQRGWMEKMKRRLGLGVGGCELWQGKRCVSKGQKGAGGP